MKNKYYIGIDGGGTKTAFGLFDYNGQLLRKIELSTSHFLQVGYDGCACILKQGVEELSQNVDKKNLFIGIGLAGYGNDENVRGKLEKNIYEVFKDYQYIITNDVHTALIGAFHEEDGILVVAGTGTIAYAKKDNQLYRVGGWGYQIGDEGSAYWIGKQLLSEFCKQADGRKHRDEVYQHIMSYFQIKNPYEMIELVHCMNNERTEIASLALLCNKLADEGHLICQSILREAGQFIFNLVYSLVQQYGICQVSCSGSLFKSEYLKQEFMNCMKAHQMKNKLPENDALYGAYLYVKQQLK